MSSSAIICSMADISTSEQRRWAFPLLNILAILLGMPVAFILFIMGGFASDTGPNTASNILVLLSLGVAVSIVGSVVLSQIKRSKRWAYIGVWIPILVVLFFIAYVFVDDYYLNPRLGPLAPNNL